MKSITIEEMKKQLPEFIPISADKKLNIDNLKEKYQLP